MIINLNIQNALNSNKNNYLNSYFEQNTDSSANCFITDIHPLYGYIPNKDMYVWSFGYYLYNMFMFNNYNEYTFSYDLKFENTNKIISYYIVYSDLSDNDEDIMYTVQSDIRELTKRFPEKIIKIYSIKKNIQIKYIEEIFIQTEFDLISLLEESLFLVTNKFSQIFCIAYLYKVKVVCTQEDIYQHYQNIFFFSYDNILDDDPYILNNIAKYLKYLDRFSLKSPQDVFTTCIHNKQFKKLTDTTTSCLSHFKDPNISTKKSIFIHHEAKHLYNIIKNGVEKYDFTLTNNVDQHSIIVFFMSENKLSKQLLLDYNLPLIAFDDNIFIMNDRKHNNLFFRYYVNRFNTNHFIQNNDAKLFIFSNEIRYFNDGIILCILDNSKGLFYNKNTNNWIEHWRQVLSYLIKTYPNNQICVKFHKNDKKNIYVQDIIKVYKVFVEEDDVDDLLLKKEIKFCVLCNGSSYVKCVQNGILVKSNKYDESLGIYDLENKNIEEELEKYDNCRDEIFHKLLNKVVSLENIKNGVFLKQVLEQTA